MKKVAVRRALAAVLGAAVLTGCSFPGSGPRSVLKPGGETVAVETAPGRSLAGELLGVRGDALVLLQRERLLEVPLASVTVVKVRGYPSVPKDQRARLLLLARYPQGLDDGHWTVLLRERGQTAFDPAPLP